MKTNILSQNTLSLRQLEKTIENGIKGYIEAGQALQLIKSKKLYKSSYRTYAEYCQKRWGFTPQHSNRLISAANVAVEMQKSEPVGSPLPQSESQVRVLSQTDNPITAWKEAQQTTGKEQPSANEIKVVALKHDDDIDVIDTEVDTPDTDNKKNILLESFSHILDQPYEFGHTSGRKQIAVDTDDASVERLENLKSMTGYTKMAIVSQALYLLEELLLIKQNREF